MPTTTANGAEIPLLGFGTWRLAGEEARRMVREAIGIGYRHIDTAVVYGNEAEVGAGIAEAIADGVVERDELFITTKVWPDSFQPDAMRASAEASLKRLGLDHVDLLLLHWPSPDVPVRTSVPALCAQQKAGLTRHIGVSNFNTSLLAEALLVADRPLVTNQVEYHPLMTQRAVLAALDAAGMAMTAYCPIARGAVNGQSSLERIGAGYGKSAIQISLRWLTQKGVIAIPKTATPAHARSNLDIFDITLTDAEMDEIDAIGRPDGRTVTLDGYAPVWDAA
ncbi:MAG: aldo/keto reductase [Pseudomonadota bacterium]